MTVKSWISGAPAIAQVNTLTVGGTAASGQVYSVTMGINNTKTVSYAAGVSDTNTTIATALQGLLAGSSYGEFLEVLWTNPSAGVIKATARTPGVPFTFTEAATGTGTLTPATVTTNSGPNDVSIAANWSTNALPANGDDIWIINNSNSMLYNLGALSAVVLNSLVWDTTFTGQCGLPLTNANGYEEYRPRFFQISAPIENFLPGTGGGSTLTQRDNGATNWTVGVSATGAPATQGRPALLLKGSGTNTLTATKGSIGSAIDPGDTASWQTINTGSQSSLQTDVSLTLGSGVTIGTINQDGGKVYINSAITTWTQRNGTAYFYGTGAVTTLDVEGGTFYYQSNGTATTVTIGADGVIDCTRDPRSRTWTNATIYGDFIDPYKTVTWSNAFSFPIGVSSNTNFGPEIHLLRT